MLTGSGLSLFLVYISLAYGQSLGSKAFYHLERFPRKDKTKGENSLHNAVDRNLNEYYVIYL
jgi:hypothetical protein